MSDVSVASLSARRAAVSALFFANGIVAGCWTVLVPVLLTTLGIGESAMGVLILAGSAAGFCFLVFAGRIISRFGSKIVSVVAGLFLAPGLLFLAAAPTFSIAVLAFIYFFVAMSVMDVAMNANGAVVEKQHDGALMSGFHGFWSFGAMAGAGAGGFVLEAGGPFALGAVAAAAISLACLAAARHLVPKRAESPDQEQRTLNWMPPRQLAVYLIGLLAFASFIAEGSVIDWSAIYLRRELASGVVYSGFAFAAFSFAMMAGRFSGDFIRNRIGGGLTIRLSAIVAAGGFLLAGMAEGLWPAVAGFLIAGLGCANIVPVAFSAAATLPGISHGTGIAIVTMFGYTGMLAGPAGFGFVGDAFGFAPVYLGFAVVMVAVAMLAQILDAPGTRRFY